jgi:hypothetical protein
MSTLNDADTLRMPLVAQRAAPDEAVTPVGRGPSNHPPRPRTAAYSDANPRWSHHPTAALSSSDRLDDPFFQPTLPPPSTDDEVPLRLPRKRGGQVALVAATIVVAAAIGAAAAGWANRARIRTAATVIPAPPADQVQSAPHPAPPIVVPVPAPPPIAQPRPRVVTPEVPRRAVEPRPARRPAEVDVQPARRAAEDQPVRQVPRRNVVWSDRLQRLVPAESVLPVEPQAPAPPSTPEAPLPP